MLPTYIVHVTQLF